MNPRRWIAALGSGPGPRRTVAWLGGVFIAVLVGLAAYDIVRGYNATVAEIERELNSQARVLAEQTARSVQAVDGVLRHVAAEYRRGRLAVHGPERLDDFLRELTVGLKQIDGLGMFDTQGDVLGVSWPSTRKPANMAQLPRFQALRDDPSAGFVIFDASRGTDDGAWIVPFARRLETAAGEFAGVVAARGRVDYFQQVYRDAYPEPSTRVALLHRNTTLLARHPPADDVLGRKLPLLDELLAAAAAGRTVARNASPIDGRQQFGAIRPVEGYPLIVAVTRDADLALAPWRALAASGALRIALLAVLATALLAVALRQLTRLQAARVSLEASQERYALAAAGSDDGIWDWDLQAGTAFESRRARELQGLPLEPEMQSIDALTAALAVHPDDAAQLSAVMQAHLAGQTPAVEAEYRVRRDGEYRWIHVRAVCSRDAAGRPARLAGSVSDIDARKRTEVALRESEERYALAMTGSNEGHWLWNIPARQVYVSAKLAELFFFDGGAQEMPDSDFFARIPLHPDDRERVHRNRNNHVAGLTPMLDHEFRIVAPGSGEVRWIHTRAQCFRDAQGEPSRMAGSTVDATQRKRAEEARHASEERFAAAVAGSDDGIWVMDYVAGTAFASPRAREIFGEPDWPEWQSIDDWNVRMERRLEPADIERRRAAVAAHLSGATPAYEFEYRVRTPQAGSRWVRARGMCVRDADGRPLRAAGSVSDIDARKRIEEALRRSEERYARAMVGSNEAHWDWNFETGEQYLSPRLIEMYGLPPGEYRTREQFLAAFTIHPEDRASWQEALQAHLSGATPRYEAEYRVVLPTGELRWLHARAQCFRDANDKAIHLTGSTSDITERKRAQAERERLEQQLRQAQKLEAIGTLAGGIAHDFNNILSAILGYGEMVQKEAGDGTPMRRHIDAAMSAGARAKSLVERILAFSRSGVGERVTVPVRAVVDEALDSIAGTLPSTVRLQRELAAGDAGVLGDATQIHQVVMNLCANAVHAMKSGGVLTVTLGEVSLDAPLAVATSTLRGGRYVRLCVGDRGSGIEPRLLERIFDPFFTTKEVGVGTGLGLSLVHGIVTDLGGGIAVDSEVGHGTTFSIYLPWLPYQAQAAAADEPLEAGGGQTVLLVDDEESLVRLGEETLAVLGYEPVGFTSATAALEAFRAAPLRFDAVLTDEAMPGMNGSDLCLEIRRLRPTIPIVLMSGYVNAALATRAKEAGAADVLTKPVVSRELARSLAAVLRARG